MDINESLDLLVHVVNGGVQRGLFQNVDDVAKVSQAINVVRENVNTIIGLQGELTIAHNHSEQLAKQVEDLQKRLLELGQ